jgi:hypothetical protein
MRWQDEQARTIRQVDQVAVNIYGTVLLRPHGARTGSRASHHQPTRWWPEGVYRERRVRNLLLTRKPLWYKGLCNLAVFFSFKIKDLAKKTARKPAFGTLGSLTFKLDLYIDFLFFV